MRDVSGLRVCTGWSWSRGFGKVGINRVKILLVDTGFWLEMI
jgi:hypothetical protein